MTTPAPESIPPLLALSALDGRYRSKIESLALDGSEFALLRERTRVEVCWFLHLAATPEIPELPRPTPAAESALRAIYEDFGLADAECIKAIEATTNHDVKAVEYFVKERLRDVPELAGRGEFVHFACTSEDINNLAYALTLGRLRGQLLDLMDELVNAVDALAIRYADLPMLSRTHGQPASPTTLGKELKVFAARLARQRRQIREQPLLGKMNGAVGNYNAHCAAYPEVDWPAVAEAFVTTLGLTPNPFTTQIEPHDYMAELFHALMRFNQVLLDFDRDVWGYIALNYFRQRKVEGETGSSTMPHKVNPIDFENSEGNLGLANALLDHLAQKLCVSRWQRDLSDSTVQRTIGSAFGYCAVAYQAALKGLGRLEVDEAAMAADLAGNWAVLGEAVQTRMRREGLEEPYERLKAATRGEVLDAAGYGALLDALALPAGARDALAVLTPEDYTGCAGALARRPLPEDQ